MEPTPTPADPAKKWNAFEWVKLAMGGGLGVMLAISCVKYLLSEAKESSTFARTTVKENTTALTEVKGALSEVKGAAVTQTTAINVAASQAAAQAAIVQQQAAAQLTALQAHTEAIKDLGRDIRGARTSTDKLTTELGKTQEAEK